MTTRTEYIEKLKQNLDQWNVEIGQWEAKARVMKTDMRIDYEMTLENLRQRRAEAETKIQELQASSEDAWKDLKAGTETAWSAIREAFSNAASHFKK